MRHLLFILFLLFTVTTNAAGLHVVFDLDGTLISTVTDPLSQNETDFLVRYEDQIFRINDFAPEVIAKLSQAGYQISFFSGAGEARNLLVVQQLQKLISERTGVKFKPFKILSTQHLTPVFGALETDRFFNRFKKDLQHVDFPMDAVLVDDHKEFILPGQEKSLLELTSDSSTVQDSQKLLVIMEVLLEAKELVDKMPIQFLKAVRGFAQGTEPGPTRNQEVYSEFMRKALARLELPTRLSERAYGILNLQNSKKSTAPLCRGIWQ